MWKLINCKSLLPGVKSETLALWSLQFDVLFSKNKNEKYPLNNELVLISTYWAVPVPLWVP